MMIIFHIFWAVDKTRIGPDQIGSDRADKTQNLDRIEFS